MGQRVIRLLRRQRRYTRATGPSSTHAHQGSAASQLQGMQEASRPQGQALDQGRADVPLEAEQVHELPVGAVQRQLIPAPDQAAGVSEDTPAMEGAAD